MTSVVIPLIKHGSKNDDLELLYALRSIEKHLKGYSEVFIISDYLPRWMKPEAVTLIRVLAGQKKQANIRKKILTACNDTRVSDPFFYSMDDIFLLQNVRAKDFPYYYSPSDLVGEKASTKLFAELKTAGLEAKHYDNHFPIVYHKEKFKASQVFSPECAVKGAYGNFNRVEGIELKDLKINSHLTYPRIKEVIKGYPSFSVGDGGMTPAMKQVLSELYPTKSKYEL